jgi:hypothetical protein
LTARIATVERAFVSTDPASTASHAAAPPANRAVVEGELRRALRSVARRRERRGPAADTARVLLLRAAPQWRGELRISVDEVVATVAPCPTVLAVLDALSAPREQDSYLVVLTPCDAGELGDSVLAHAIGQEVRPVNRWDLVADAFGASRLDPRLTKADQRWLAEALLDAQPAGGWRHLAGPVLGLDTALRRLAGTRFGGPGASSGDSGVGSGADETVLDAAALLAWTRDEAAVARFLALRPEERAGLTGWLSESIGPVAKVVFAMLGHADITDAVPFGLAAAELYPPAGNGAASYAAVSDRPESYPPGPGRAASRPVGKRGTGAPGPETDGSATLQARVRTEERYFDGKAPDVADLARFAEAAQSLVTRWSDTGHADLADSVCEQAERILAGLGVDELAGASDVLDAGFDARLAVLAEGLGRVLPAPLPVDLRPVEEAWHRLGDHRRAKAHSREMRAAAAAVRLVRWLAAVEEPPATLAGAAMSALGSWSWADRALAVVAAADPAHVPRASAVYAALCAAVWERRAELDRAFAERLAAWTEASGVTGDLLLVENMLARIARPVAERQPPLLVVVDAMSTAVASELAEEIAAAWPWVEVGRRGDGREPAIAGVPSITSVSRTSLLSGVLRTGGQPEEQAGFAAFWRGRQARLFHKADLRGEPGQRLNPAVRDAIRDPATVVGVVLNTIDDALDRGREGDAPHWRLDGLAYLRDLLDEAWRAGRPVILTADHGHVLDRGAPIRGESAGSARYRTGTPGDGELTIKGPRVLAGGGEIVAAWDERIHYTPRKAGYHGGAAPAEMVVPVLVFVSSPSLRPKGWEVLGAPGHAPPWWDSPLVGWGVLGIGIEGVGGAVSGAAPPGVPDKAAGRRQKAALRVAPAPEQADTLFDVGEAAGVPTAGAQSLGEQVAASQLLATQRQFARRAPGDEQVAALIDGLAMTGGKVPVAAAAELVGEPVFRMAGYLAQVARLLNVDGYRVIGEADGGRTVELNLELLRQQFLGDMGGPGGSSPPASTGGPR